MSKKTFNLIVGILTAASTAAVAIVTSVGPEKATIINSSITIAVGAVIEICSLFTKEEESKEK